MTYLTDSDREHIRHISPRAIILRIAQEVAEEADIAVEDIMGESRKREHARARHLVMHIASRHGMGISEIARAMRRDHTTVLHGINRASRERVENLMERPL